MSTPAKITKTGESDYYCRPLYIDLDTGDIYVDVEYNDNRPAIHTITQSGEPNYPVTNFQIVADIFSL